MALKQKRIAVIFCGETPIPYAEFSQKNVEEWMHTFDEVDILSDFNVEVVEQRAGIELQADAWKKVSRKIHKTYDQYDAFVVVHAMDQLLTGIYSTAFMLGKVGKPVAYTTVSVGRMKRKKEFMDFKGLFHGYSDVGLRSNIVNALQFASMPISGHAFVFGNTIFPALRSFSVSSAESQIFDTLDREYWGIFNVGVRLLTEKAPKPNTDRPQLVVPRETKVRVLDPFALANTKIKDLVKNESLDGIFIRADETGRLPRETMKQLSELIREGIIVGLFHKNLAGKPDQMENIVTITGVTWEAALAKFVWSVGQTKDMQKIGTIMGADRSGEYRNQEI